MNVRPRIVIDIVHPADLNFYKQAVGILRKEHNVDVEMLIQPRGNLTAIAEREYPDIPCRSFGRHRGSLLGKAVNLVFRDLQLLYFLGRRNYRVSTGFQGICPSHVSWLLRRPSVVFDDDAGNRYTFYPYKPFATRIVMPECIPERGRNIINYRGFKELAYLHPHYFTPDPGVLDDYGLEAGKYVFIREISNKTANYRGSAMGESINICPYLRQKGYTIVLSLEEKSLEPVFREYCTVLQEPVRDIYSLMYYADLTISSGDTMVRESCLLGTPAIYTGKNLMPVNRELEKLGCLFQAIGTEKTIDLIDTIRGKGVKDHTRRVIENGIATEWDDTTEVIVKNLLEYIRDSG